ncbi:helix-turn-helix domain-containing protein [Candidatus Zixiibacteriota bacterium]
MSSASKSAPLSIGSQIRRIRKDRGLSLKQVADRAGTSAPTMHRYEGGYEGYSYPTLRKIANALDADLEIRFKPRSQTRNRKGSAGMVVTSKLLYEKVRSLFWDRKLTVDDLDEFPIWVIQRILTEGNLSQARLVVAYYGLDNVSDAVQGRGVDEKTRGFWECLLERTA